MSLTPFRDQLRENRFFSSLGEETLSHFLAHARRNEYASGATIFVEGEPSLGLYWLASGTLKVVKTSTSGKEQTLHYVKAGKTFNEAGAFSTLPNPASIIALEASQVWRIPAEIIRNQIQADPAFAQLVIDTLSMRLRHQVTLIEDLSLRSVTSRLASLILEESKEDLFIRPNWLTQSELAARLGTVEDVVRRSLRKLETANLIDVSRQQIRVLNRSALQNLAN